MKSESALVALVVLSLASLSVSEATPEDSDQVLVAKRGPSEYTTVYRNVEYFRGVKFLWFGQRRLFSRYKSSRLWRKVLRYPTTREFSLA